MPNRLLVVAVLVLSVAVGLLWIELHKQRVEVDSAQLRLVVYIDRIQSIERDLYGANLDEGTKTRRPVTVED